MLSFYERPHTRTISAYGSRFAVTADVFFTAREELEPRIKDISVTYRHALKYAAGRFLRKNGSKWGEPGWQTLDEYVSANIPRDERYY